MVKKATLTFQGMDTDTADHFMKEGKYRDALNVHIGSSEGDNMFSVENVKGNSLVSYSLPSGANKVIGSHEDIVNKCVYYFLSNSSTINIQSTSGTTVTTSSAHGLVLSDLVAISGISGRTNILGTWIVKPLTSTSFDVLNPLTYITPSLQSITLTGTSGTSGIVTKYSHRILKYDLVTNSISLVYAHSRLGFNPDYIITGTALINGVLHWTDGLNPIRSLDLSECGGYGTFFVESMIDFIRIPPTKPLTVTGKWTLPNGTVVPYSSNKNLTNNMQDKSYQFRYRYVYYDDTNTVWSTISTTVDTGFVDDRKNTIDITISNEETTNYLFYSKVIRYIELAFRDDTTTSFKYISRIDFPASSTSAVVVFKNDTSYSIISEDDSNKFNDSVPIIAGSLAGIQNRVFVGDCTEGFDVDQNAVTASGITYGGSFAKNTITWKFYSPYEVGIVYSDRADRHSQVYKLIRSEPLRGTSNLRVPSFTLTGQPPIWATHYQIVRTSSLSRSFFIQGYCMLSKRRGTSTEVVFNGLNGALMYAPQVGDYLISLQTPVIGGFYTLPTKYRIIGSGADLAGNPTIVLEGDALDLTQIFPFILVEIYSPVQNADQFFYEVGYRQQIKNPGTSSRSLFTAGLSGVISMSSVVSGDVHIRRLNDSINYHSRVVLAFLKVETLTNNNNITVGINNSNFSITVNGTSGLSAGTQLVSKINESSLFRAIVIKDDGTFLVYDIKEGASGGISVTQATTYTVAGQTVGVQEVVAGRVDGAGAQSIIDNTYVEAMTANDSQSTWQKNIGRPNIQLQNGDKQQRRQSLVRFGGKYINDSTLNKINSFDYLDQEPMSNFGSIKKLIPTSNNQAEGSVLLAIQDNEISSLYIGQVVLRNAGGGQNVATSDKVIGSINGLQKLVGSVNPESIAQHNGIVYGFDALRGIVWRYGQDGLTLISEETGGGAPAGMRNFFYTRSQYLLQQGTFKCFAGIDPYNNEYILSVPNTDTEKITVVWSETLNAWTSFMSFVGESYQKINTGFMSFKNGQLWTHRTNSLFNNFYGVQYKSKIKGLMNQEPLESKILQRVEQVAKGSQWDCTDIATPAGQSSELIGLYDIANPNALPADFRRFENRFSGAVLRDKNTPAMQASDYPLLRGDVIRSDVFTILMENDKTSQQNLYAVDLSYVNSYRVS